MAGASDTIDIEKENELIPLYTADPLRAQIGQTVPLTAEFFKKPYDNVTRRAKVTLFMVCLGSHAAFNKLTTAERFAMASAIERACYNSARINSQESSIRMNWTESKFQNEYTSVCSLISTNLDATNSVKNIRLANAVISGSVDIKTLPRLSSQELFPEKYADITTRINNAKGVEIKIKTSSMHTCPRCYKKESTSKPRYNRSLDECVNQTHTCVNCDHEWNA